MLAQRAAAAQRMLNSMTPEQRAELMELSQQAFGDPRLAQQLAQLDAQLQALRPGEDWSGFGAVQRRRPAGPRRGRPGDGGARPSSTRWPSSWRRATRARGWRTSTSMRSRQQLGDEATRRRARGWPSCERELRDQGLFERAPDGSLAAVAQGAAAARADGAARRLSDRSGPVAASATPPPPGAAGEPSGSTRPWAFGDTEPWDVPRTLRNAVAAPPSRGGVRASSTSPTWRSSRPSSGPGRRWRCCVDTSWSMVQDGRWVPMKRTALALHQLISTRFRNDALQLITFGRYAGVVELPRADRAWRAPGSRAPTRTTRCCWPAGTCGGTRTRSRWC